MRMPFVAMPECLRKGARYTQACQIAGITPEMVLQWPAETRRAAIAEPANKLTENERPQVLQVCSDAKFASLLPSGIVPVLAERRIYFSSESRCYRILKAEEQLHHRGNSKPRGTYTRPVSYTVRGLRIRSGPGT